MSLESVVRVSETNSYWSGKEYRCGSNETDEENEGTRCTDLVWLSLIFIKSLFMDRRRIRPDRTLLILHPVEVETRGGSEKESW